jgi:hypothetical protein
MNCFDGLEGFGYSQNYTEIVLSFGIDLTFLLLFAD